MENLPSNSRHPQQPEKRVARVTSGRVVTRKPPLGRRFIQLFVAGDSHSVGQYVFLDVLLPAARDMITDAFTQGFERLIYGETRTVRRTGANPASGGYTNYRSYSGGGRMVGGPPRDAKPVVARQERMQHVLDDIILENRHAAQEVLDELRDTITKYTTASVRDLYDILGLDTQFTDENYGWSDVNSATILRVRDGYRVNLPAPYPLD